MCSTIPNVTSLASDQAVDHLQDHYAHIMVHQPVYLVNLSVEHTPSCRTHIIITLHSSGKGLLIVPGSRNSLSPEHSMSLLLGRVATGSFTFGQLLLQPTSKSN